MDGDVLRQPTVGSEWPATAGKSSETVEEAVAEIWADVLGVERAELDHVHSDFFLLGGHSLLAVQVIARLLERFQEQLPSDTFEIEGLLLRRIFEEPTVVALADCLQTNGLLRSGGR
jgi:acyl carrier protein